MITLPQGQCLQGRAYSLMKRVKDTEPTSNDLIVCLVFSLDIYHVSVS